MKVNKEYVITFIICSFIIAFVLGQTLITNICIGGLIIYWFLDREAIRRINELVYKKEFWAISSLFWLTLIGLIYTDIENQSEGWKYVERRLGLLIFPLILGTVELPKFLFNILIKIVIGLVIIVGVLGLGNSYYNYSNTSDLAFFYNNNLLSLFGHQAVYFSLFINIVLLLLIPRIKSITKSTEYAFYVCFLLFCLLFQYFLASRLSLLISILIVTYCIFNLSVERFGKKITITIGSIVGILIIFLASLSTNTIDRFKSLGSIEYDITSMEDEYNLNDEGKAANWNGLTIRFAIWKCAVQLIADHPIFGVGTGDYRGELFKYYKKNKFEYGIARNYTTHNQYIYLLVTYGLFGLISFLLGVYYLAKYAIAEGQLVLIMVLSVFVISFVTENILNTNFGIILFSFFISILVCSDNKLESFKSSIKNRLL